MRAVIQRVLQAEVKVAGVTVNKIDKGLLAFLCIERGDTEKDIQYMSDKIINLRIFPDSDDVPNISLLDAKGELLAVSQFTLSGDARKGRRPSYSSAELPAVARLLFDSFCELTSKSVPVKTGVFQADMQISLVNDGPFTILLSSRKEF